ncbi:MAG TPA: formate dehydrogenase-N subunit alpha [Desulfotomaculum sp.]|nr:formate dehydrogenase-N subunit alpha [Desulfotomaculum sp.]
MKKDLSRRDFLKYLGLGTAGTALFEGAAAVPAIASGGEHPSFDVPPSKLKRAKETPTVCSYCGCGCGIVIYSEDNSITHIEGDPDNPINVGSLCPKGSGISDAHTIVEKVDKRVPNKNRVTDVLYRAPGSSDWEVKDWDWAFSEIAKRVKKTRDASFELKDDKGVTVNRAEAIGHLGSASLDNEENYLLHKIHRALGTVNMDHHARLCHSSTVAGLANSFGRGAMTNHFIDYRNSGAFLIIGANPAENHPQAMRWIGAAKLKGAKIIVVDPRFTKTASKSDIHVRIRPGTDIAFLNGMMNYVIENNLFFYDYVLNYTNASCLVSPDYAYEEGLFSGAEVKDGKFTYDSKKWDYQKDGDEIKKDPTLQDPRCVFQILKQHMSRYDLNTVSKITGAPESLLREAYDAFGATGKRDKAGNVIYAMGITQHSYGAQNVRGTAMVQLLLGNIGIAGGGVNAQRGESNVQGSTDMAMLYHYLPGYLNCPVAPKHPTLEEYIKVETPKTSYWSNKPKFLISMLKAWYGEAAAKENDFCYDWLPKLDGKDHSHMAIFEKMDEGVIKGFFAWGQNPAVGGPLASAERKAMEKLDWMVSVDLFPTETATFWKRPGVNPADIKTEVFMLPAAFSYEKEGTVANSGRWLQFRWKAVDPPGAAESDLWIADRLFKAIRKEYQSGGVFTDPIMKMVWNYDTPGMDEPDINKVGIEINGYTIADGKPLETFAKLTDDGATACGLWIYAGYWAEDPDAKVPACQRRIPTDKSGLGLYPKWTFAWPLNRRIIYNRCSCDPAGQPWNPERVLVQWDGAKWVTNDVPDFGFKDAKTKEPTPPEKTAKAPYIMVPEGVGRLFAPGMKEGPLTEHYEPVESPVKNLIGKQQNNPLATKYKGNFSKLAETGSKEFPYIATTHRLIEHYQSGAVTRNCPWLVELMPEMFATISPGLAKKLGIKAGDDVLVSSARGEIECKANVMPIIQPLKINGSMIEIICMPIHWGYAGLAPGASVNDLTPCIGDANTNIPEYKAFLCNIRKA